MNDEQKKNEEMRRHDRLVKKALTMDADILAALWKIFPMEQGLIAYHVYEQFLDIYNKRDALEAAILYELKYED